MRQDVEVPGEVARVGVEGEGGGGYRRDKCASR